MAYPDKWNILLFLIAALLSIFSSDIRSFLLAAVRIGGLKYTQRSLSVLERRLQVLNALYGNAYAFFVWLCVELRWVVFAALSVLMAWFYNPTHRGGFFLRLLSSITIGVAFGTVIRISRIVELLEDYDRSKAYLERRIEALRGKFPTLE